jgi:hypothetical protein
MKVWAWMLALVAATSAFAGPMQDRVARDLRARPCIWPDDDGISVRDPRTQSLPGIEIQRWAGLAKAIGARLLCVDCSFAPLIKDVKSHRGVPRWSDIDQTGVVVAVHSGPFTEPVMKPTLKQAPMGSIKPPAKRERELEGGRADWAMLVEPPRRYVVLQHACAVKPADDAWLEELDPFVQRIQRDGRVVVH